MNPQLSGMCKTVLTAISRIAKSQKCKHTALEALEKLQLLQGRALRHQVLAGASHPQWSYADTCCTSSAV